MWTENDEQIFQRMKSDYEKYGDINVKFNGQVGNLSSLIEATEIVRSMFKH